MRIFGTHFGGADDEDFSIKEEQAVIEIMREFKSATKLHPTGMRSAHEGYAVLKEEVDELWGEVKKKQSARSLENLRKEAIQVGAMALRFLVDVV